MNTKDYYGILELKPSATLPEIKTAYKKLALRFHPDKNNNDTAALAHFTIIKEAYEILSDPRKKEYYLQQRWYNQSIGKKFQSKEPLTPPEILKYALDLNKYLSTVDEHRMDKYGLCEYISDILTDETIDRLNRFNDIIVNDEIIHSVLNSARRLPLTFNAPIQVRVKKINMSANTREWIDQYISYQQRTHKWEKNRIWLVLLIVLLISFTIFLMA